MKRNPQGGHLTANPPSPYSSWSQGVWHIKYIHKAVLIAFHYCHTFNSQISLHSVEPLIKSKSLPCVLCNCNTRGGQTDAPR